VETHATVCFRGNGSFGWCRYGGPVSAPAGSETTFGPLLRRYRLVANLTQSDLARASALSLRTVRNLERGTGQPQRATASALADGLGLTGSLRDRLLAVARSQPPVGGNGDPVAGRHSLPPDPPDFIGRAAELGALRTTFGGASGGTVVVSGLPGVGKTTLVVRMARTLLGPSASTVLFQRLATASGPTARPEQVLGDLLSALGISGDRIPTAGPERVALYRSLTADRTGVLILDNAVDEEQVRPLLPAGAGWVTLVTSRSALVGLAGVRRVLLDPLPEEDALALLGAVVGPRRMSEHPGAAEQTVRMCGGVPMALRLAAGQLTDRPSWTLERLAELLRDEQRRLDVLQDAEVAVRSAFAVSYERLVHAERALLRRCALLESADVHADVAAALVDGDPVKTADRLDALIDTGLLGPAAEPDRFVMHDLVRVFAAERAALEEPGDELDRALDRAEHRLLCGVAEAATFLEPHPDPSGGAPDAASTPRLALTSAADAVAWLTAERAGWWWALRRAAARDRHRVVIGTARALHWYSDREIQAAPWDEVFGLAVAAARAIGDEREEAVQRSARGWAYEHRDRLLDGLAEQRRALAYFESVGDTVNAAWTLWGLAAASGRGGRSAEAVGYAHRAVELFAARGDEPRVLLVRSGLLQDETVLGGGEENYRRMRELVAALDLPDAPISDLTARCRALLTMAEFATERGLGDDAVGYAREAMDLSDNTDVPVSPVWAATTLGWALARDDPRRAEGILRGAVELAVRTHSASWEALARFTLGRVLSGPARAREWERAAELCDLSGEALSGRLAARIARARGTAA
jgi:tetratricopeptide (TPR) repeat protein/DNA-binding XRE family transcriptional regulator